LMNAGVENFRAANEIACMPIRKGDFTAERRGIKYADSTAFDQENAVMLCALAEDRLPPAEDLAASLFQDRLPLAHRQLVHQGWRTADQLLVLGEKQGRGWVRRRSRRRASARPIS